MDIKRSEKKEKQKEVNITKKLQNLVKKKKRDIIVIKAGSIKTSTSNSSSTEDYYPSLKD